MVAVRLVFWSLSLSKEIPCTIAYMYSQKDHKTPLLHQRLGSLCLSFSLSLPPANSLECGNPLRSLSCLLSRPPREGTLCLCEQCKPCSRVLLVICINQGILASFSLSLSCRWLWTTRFQSVEGQQQVAPKQGPSICGILNGVTWDLLRSGPIEVSKY